MELGRVEMIHLSTQSDFQNVRNPPFCYLCGELIDSGVDFNYDHVPPQSVFLKEDRTPPLKIRVHSECNNELSTRDEDTAHWLRAIVRKSLPEKSRLRFQVEYGDTDDEPELYLYNFNFRDVVWRFVRAFHAALYTGFLPKNSHGEIFGPYWETTDVDEHGNIQARSQTELDLLDALNQNVIEGTMDSIKSYNGKSVYQCTWVENGVGSQICIFSFQLYNWEIAGAANLPRRKCWGYYLHSIPNVTTKAN